MDVCRCTACAALFRRRACPADLRVAKGRMAVRMAVLQQVDGQAHSAEWAWDAASHFRLRWFTPTVEVPLCGHATLAAAAALMQGGAG